MEPSWTHCNTQLRPHHHSNFWSCFNFLGKLYFKLCTGDFWNILWIIAAYLIVIVQRLLVKINLLLSSSLDPQKQQQIFYSYTYDLKLSLKIIMLKILTCTSQIHTGLRSFCCHISLLYFMTFPILIVQLYKVPWDFVEKLYQHSCY